MLACNRKVAGSSPTRVSLFVAYECTQLYPQIRCLSPHPLKGTIGPGELVNISNLCYFSFLVKPHLVKTLVEKKKKAAEL